MINGVPLVVTCPDDGDHTLGIEDVFVDFAHELIGFTCPDCGDLVRRAMPARPTARDQLARAARMYGVPMVNLAGRCRGDVCGGRAMEPADVITMVGDLDIKGAIEMQVDRWAAA